MAVDRRFPYAGYVPSQLLRLPSWWLVAQTRLVLVVAVLLACLFGLTWIEVIPIFSTAAADGEIEERTRLLKLCVEAGIAIVAVLAYWRTAGVLARMQVESDGARFVTKGCEEELRRIQGGETPLELADGPKLWPQNPTPGLIVGRLCDALHSDAVESQFGSREMMLQHFQDELADAVSEVVRLQKSALNLGILGTFMGLFLSMPQLAKVVSDNSQKANFEPVFDALSICFATSVVGLVVSLWVGLFLVAMAVSRQRRFLGLLEEMLGRLMTLVRKAVNREHMARTLDNLSQRLNSVEERIVSQTERMREQTETIARGLGGLQQTRAELETFLKELSTATVRTSQAIEAVGGTIEGLLAKRTTTEESALQRMAETLRGIEQHLGTELDKVFSRVSTVLDQQKEAAVHEASLLNQVRADVLKGVTAWKEPLSQLGQRLTDEQKIVAELARQQTDLLEFQKNLLKELVEWRKGDQLLQHMDDGHARLRDTLGHHERELKRIAHAVGSYVESVDGVPRSPSNGVMSRMRQWRDRLTDLIRGRKAP